MHTLLALQGRAGQRRRAILDAALGCFARQGFAATTIDDIRRAARASIGSIYHHFAGKEQLAAALFVEGLRDYQHGLLEKLARERRRQRPARRTAKRGVTLIVEQYLAWVAANPDWARYLLEMGHAQFVEAVRGEIEEMNRRFYGELAAWFAPHIERGEIVRLPLVLYLPILVGPARDFARHWLRGSHGARGAAVDIRQASHVFAEAAWRALRGGRKTH
jgi:AcrR family transcriptional regulator